MTVIFNVFVIKILKSNLHATKLVNINNAAEYFDREKKKSQ